MMAIDSRDLKIKSRWPVAPAVQLASIAVDLVRRHLFIGGHTPRMLVVIDCPQRKNHRSPFPISDRVDANVKTEFGAKTMGLDPKTHHLYLITSDFGHQRQPSNIAICSQSSSLELFDC